MTVRPLCFAVTAAVAIVASPAAAQPVALPSDLLDDTLAKVVKLYGAGGFRGLESYGTGFLASGEGHVVTGWGPLLDADTVTVVLDDGRRFEAKLVGADPDYGLALLKFDTSGGLPHFDLAAAAEAVPGDRVLALSNMFKVAAGDEPVSVMHGMVLAKAPLDARRGRAAVRLDTPVYFLDAVTNNPGAAGGVVVGLDGLPIGMIGRELQGENTETWINYAVPMAALRDRVAAMIAGEVAGPRPSSKPDVPPRRPVAVGLVMVPDVVSRTPAYVTEVLSDSAAAAAGLRSGDLLLFVNGDPVRSVSDLTTAFTNAEAGEPASLVVRRAGRLETLTLNVPD